MISKVSTAVLVVAILALLVFVWPSRYRYDHTSIRGQRVPVRIERVSGNAQVLLEDGWTDMKKAQRIIKPLSRRVRELSSTQDIAGRGGLEEYGHNSSRWEASIYNGTEWTLTELTISLQYEGLDRAYRINCNIPPLSSGTCSTRVDWDLMVHFEKKHRESPDWSITGAKGYPPPGYRPTEKELAREKLEKLRSAGRLSGRLTLEEIISPTNFLKDFEKKERKAEYTRRIRIVKEIGLATVAGILALFGVRTLLRGRRRTKPIEVSSD